MRTRVAALLLVASSTALALPKPGEEVRVVAVGEIDGRERMLPDGPLPILVFYEDKDAGSQNRHTRVAVGRYTDRPENGDKFTFLPVADVEKWNWWPAKRYVVADVRKVAKETRTTLLLDWKGAVRKAWGLRAGKSGVLLLAPGGRVLFAGEGPLTEAQVADLVARLEALGAHK